jgi:hypothetical protein
MVIATIFVPHPVYILFGFFVFAALCGFIVALFLQRVVFFMTKIRLQYLSAYYLSVYMGTLYWYIFIAYNYLPGLDIPVNPIWFIVIAYFIAALISAELFTSRIKYSDGRSVGYIKRLMISSILILILAIIKFCISFWVYI